MPGIKPAVACGRAAAMWTVRGLPGVLAMYSVGELGQGGAGAAYRLIGGVCDKAPEMGASEDEGSVDMTSNPCCEIIRPYMSL